MGTDYRLPNEADRHFDAKARRAAEFDRVDRRVNLVEAIDVVAGVLETENLAPNFENVSTTFQAHYGLTVTPATLTTAVRKRIELDQKS